MKHFFLKPPSLFVFVSLAVGVFFFIPYVQSLNLHLLVQLLLIVPIVAWSGIHSFLSINVFILPRSVELADEVVNIGNIPYTDDEKESHSWVLSRIFICLFWAILLLFATHIF